MTDYIRNNSKRYIKEKNCKKCVCQKFQSYNAIDFGDDVKICTPNSCFIQKTCSKNQYAFNKYVSNQQNLYAKMRRNPELFPIISSAKNIGLTLQQQRAYSNNWYRQFGTSQNLPINDNWGGFYLIGSDVPYTN